MRLSPLAFFPLRGRSYSPTPASAAAAGAMGDAAQRGFSANAGSRSPVPGRKRSSSDPAAQAFGEEVEEVEDQADQLVKNISELDGGGEFSAWTGITSVEFGQV